MPSGIRSSPRIILPRTWKQRLTAPVPLLPATWPGVNRGPIANSVAVSDTVGPAIDYPSSNTIPLTLYPTNVADGGVPTADDLNPLFGQQPSSTVQSKVGTTAVNYWVELWAQGNASIVTSATEFNPTGQGYVWPNSPIGGRFVAGTWTFKQRLAISTSGATATADLHIRAYKLNAGVYTLICEAVGTGLALTSTVSQFTASATGIPQVAFASGDELYIDIQLFVTATTGFTAATQFNANQTASSTFYQTSGYSLDRLLVANRAPSETVGPATDAPVRSAILARSMTDRVAGKPLLRGLLDRGDYQQPSGVAVRVANGTIGDQLSYVASQITGIVAQVNWADLQPSSQGQALQGGGAGPSTYVGTSLIEDVRDYAAPLSLGVRMRLNSTKYSPAWAMSLYDGSIPALDDGQPSVPMTIVDEVGSGVHIIPAWWTSAFGTAWDDVVTKLAALYDTSSGNNFAIRSADVAASGAATVFPEFSSRQMKDLGGPNNMAIQNIAFLRLAGYSFALDDTAIKARITAAASAWKNTPCATPFNNFDKLTDVDGPIAVSSSSGGAITLASAPSGSFTGSSILLYNFIGLIKSVTDTTHITLYGDRSAYGDSLHSIWVADFASAISAAVYNAGTNDTSVTLATAISGLLAGYEYIIQPTSIYVGTKAAEGTWPVASVSGAVVNVTTSGGWGTPPSLAGLGLKAILGNYVVTAAGELTYQQYARAAGFVAFEVMNHSIGVTDALSQAEGAAPGSLYDNIYSAGGPIEYQTAVDGSINRNYSGPDRPIIDTLLNAVNANALSVELPDFYWYRVARTTLAGTSSTIKSATSGDFQSSTSGFNNGIGKGGGLLGRIVINGHTYLVRSNTQQIASVIGDLALTIFNQGAGVSFDATHVFDTSNPFGSVPNGWLVYASDQNGNGFTATAQSVSGGGGTLAIDAWVLQTGTGTVPGNSSTYFVAPPIPSADFATGQSYEALKWDYLSPTECGIYSALLAANDPGPSSASDTIKRVGTLRRSPTESVGPATETVVRLGAYKRTDSDSVGPALDISPVRAYTGSRASTDSVGPAADVVAPQQALKRTLSDSVGPASATLVRLLAALRAPSDTVGPTSDTVSAFKPGISYSASVTDTVGAAADTVARAFAGLRSAAENLTISDAVAAAQALGRSVTDTVGPAAASVSRVFVGFRSAIDTVTSSDIVARLLAAVRARTDTVGPAADASPTRQATLQRSVTDSVGPTGDVPVTKHSTTRSVVDSVGPAFDVLVVIWRSRDQIFEDVIARVRTGVAFASVRTGAVVAKVRTGVATATVRTGAVVARVRSGIANLRLR